MKKLILLIGIIILGISCNNQQTKADKMANKLLNKITNICQLTPDQTTKVMQITDSFMKVRQENKDKYPNDMEAFKNAMKANRAKLIDTLKTVLTSDQFEKLKSAFEQQKAKQNEQGEGQDNGD